MYEEILKDENIKKTFLILLGILVLFFAIKTLGEFRACRFIGAGLNPVTTISVNGTGEVNVTPDIATFTFTVTEEAKAVKEAQDKVSKTVADILSALKEQGIKEKDIKTQNYNIYPRYEYLREIVACPQGFDCSPPSGTRTLVGYEVSQSVEVKVRVIDKAGEVLSALGALNVDNLFGPNFSIEDEDELKAEAREMAIKEAKEKAEKLADDLGVKLVRIVSFDESSPYGYPVYDRALAESGIGGGGAVTPPLPTGENTIRSDVFLVFEIR